MTKPEKPGFDFPNYRIADTEQRQLAHAAEMLRATGAAVKVAAEARAARGVDASHDHRVDVAEFLDYCDMLHGQVVKLLERRARELASAEVKPDDRGGRLTAREVEIARGLVVGRKNSEIAKDLKISVKTVDKHRANVLKKLGVRNNVELVRLVGVTP